MRVPWQYFPESSGLSVTFHKQEEFTLRKIRPQKSVQSQISPGEEWESFWHGYFQLREARSEEKRTRDKTTHSQEHARSVMSESQVEQQLLFDALFRAEDSTFRMAELGAGRGDWTLAAAGCIQNLSFSPALGVTIFHGLAIEAEPQHYQWTKRHIQDQGIPASSLQAAISSRKGNLPFSSVANPADNYGQSLSSSGNLLVETTTLDDAIPSYFDHQLDLIHMDIQGEELRAILGARRLLKRSAPRTLIIGTHAAWLNWAIKATLSPSYNCLLDVKPRSGMVTTPFGVAFFPADGLMYFSLRTSRSHLLETTQTALIQTLLIADRALSILDAAMRILSTKLRAAPTKN